MANNPAFPALIEALRNPLLYPHPVAKVQVLETHISWVILAGRFAYKIKKPVNFGFLNFSELTLRRFYCEEEVRLNRRLAPDLYLEVTRIAGHPDRPTLGKEPAFEYAVKMRRFALDKTLDALLANGQLKAEQVDDLAISLAHFHASLPPCENSDYGNANAVWAPAAENFHQLAPLCADSDLLKTLASLSQSEFERCRTAFEQRQRAGMIRECHGDLHLGNIVLLRGRPTPFDGLEFNPALRWIDVASDIAFLLMDLQHYQRSDLSYRLLNTYLQINGDFSSLKVLHFYMAYRAMVRAKVSALRASQGHSSGLDECHHYLTLTRQIYAVRRPALIMTHGLPGCGKTALSQLILEKFGAIRLRSDVERKRLFALEAWPDDQLYTDRATERTYGRLLELAEQILRDGFPVIIDAASLRHQERQRFRDLAHALTLPFVLVTIHSDDHIQRQRIAQRQTAANRDASDADVAIYEYLKAKAEPLTIDEQALSVAVINNGSLEQLANDKTLWQTLALRSGLTPV